MKLLPLKPFLLFAIIFPLILIFSLLAKEVIENQTYNLDLDINIWVANLRNPFWNVVMNSISDFGLIGGIFIVGFISSNLLFHKRIHVLIGLLFAAIGAGLFTYFLKLIIARNRPELVSRLVTESGFSFPSGHATTAFVAFPILALTLYNNSKIPLVLKYLLVSLILVFPFVVAFSRLYLGVHYFTDVVAGGIVGLTATCIFYYFYSEFEYDKKL
jgi:membrane-associated phospholipid phosphatase